MHAQILFLVSLLSICAAWSPNGQTTDDKKKATAAQNDTPKITADVEVNGKTLDQWIKLIPGKDRSLTKAAIESILAYDPEVRKKAVPVMVAELKKHNPAANKSLPVSVRTTIPQPLALILTTVKEPDPNEVAEAVAILRRLLKDPQVIVKLRVTQAITQMGPMAKDALPELIHLAKDHQAEDWEVRNVAILALGTVGHGEKSAQQQEVWRALMHACLEDPAVLARLSALQSLNIMLRVSIDTGSKKAIYAELQKMILKDPDPMCKLRAHLTSYSLLENAAEKTKRRQIVATYFDNKDQHIRLEAVQAFGLIGEEAKDQVPRLIGLLQDKNLSIVAASVVALAHIKDKRSLDQLQLLFNDQNMPELVRNTAKDAIDIISGVGSRKDEPKKGGQ